MPTWYPKTPLFHSSAEDLVFKCLDRQLGPDWIACHSHETLVRRSRIEMGEADFVLFHPNHGLFILEVKGGNISYSPDQGWLGQDLHGHEIGFAPSAFGQTMLSVVLQ